MGVARPTNQPNAWVADPAEERPTLTLSWSEPQTLARVELMFDTDFDHPMETVLWGHPEDRMPFCVRGYRLLDETGRVLAECPEQHQTLGRRAAGGAGHDPRVDHRTLLRLTLHPRRPL